MKIKRQEDHIELINPFTITSFTVFSLFLPMNTLEKR